MTDITIDSLVVKLGLDSSAFQKGAKDVTQELENARKTTEKTSRDIAANGKRAAEFFGQLEKAALKFFAVITAGRGMADFTRTIIQGGATLDRMSTRLGVSADTLSRWQGAVRQSGGTGEAFLGTIQNLSQEITNIATKGDSSLIPWLSRLGVSTVDASGKAKTALELFQDIGDAANAKVPNQANRFNFLRQMGFDEGSINLLMKGRQERERLINEQKGYSDADARRARETQERLERIKLNIERTTQELVTRLLPSIEKFAGVMEKFATTAVPVIIEMIDKFTELDKATGGWSTNLLLALATLRIMGGAGVIGGITKLAGALGGAAAAVLLLKGDESEGSQEAKQLAAKAAGSDSVMGDRASAVQLARTQLNNQWWRKLFGGEITEQEVQERADQLQGGYKTVGAGAPSGRLSRAERNNNPGNLEFRGQAGASRENGEGRFASFESPEAGVAALARQLQLYGKRGIDTVEGIISKYAPASENDTGAYIDAITKRLGVAPGEKLDLNNAETLSGLIQGISRHEAGRSFLSDNQVMSGLSMAGVGGQNQGSTTSIGEIKVYTQATDAKGIARDIRGAMVRQSDSGVY